MRFAPLLVCATLSAQTPLPPFRGVHFYRIEKEKALGAQLAAEYRRRTRVIDSPSVNAYLEELGQRIAAQAPAMGFPYTFELADDDQTWSHEAAAFPGGPVFVPARLILAAADKDQRLAALQAATRQLPPATYPAHSGLDPIQQEVTHLSPRPTKTPPRLAR